MFAIYNTPATCVVMLHALHAQVVQPLLSEQHRTVPFNDPDSSIIEVDTPLFTGQALLLLRNLPNTPSGVFEGKRRQMCMTVQVRLHCTMREVLQADACSRGALLLVCMHMNVQGPL